jgi:hypothetical protein
MDIQGRMRPRLSKIGVLLVNVQEHSVEYTNAEHCQHTLILIVIDAKAQPADRVPSERNINATSPVEAARDVRRIKRTHTQYRRIPLYVCVCLIAGNYKSFPRPSLLLKCLPGLLLLLFPQRSLVAIVHSRPWQVCTYHPCSSAP